MNFIMRNLALRFGNTLFLYLEVKTRIQGLVGGKPSTKWQDYLLEFFKRPSKSSKAKFLPLIAVPFLLNLCHHLLQWVLLETGSSLYLRWLVIFWVVLAIRYNYIHVKMKSFPLWCQFMDIASTPQANLEQDHSSLLCSNTPNISNSIIFLSLDWKNSRLDNHKTNWERKKKCRK